MERVLDIYRRPYDASASFGVTIPARSSTAGSHGMDPSRAAIVDGVSPRAILGGSRAMLAPLGGSAYRHSTRIDDIGTVACRRQVMAEISP